MEQIRARAASGHGPQQDARLRCEARICAALTKGLPAPQPVALSCPLPLANMGAPFLAGCFGGAAGCGDGRDARLVHPLKKTRRSANQKKKICFFLIPLLDDLK